jgi:hypothetical protein
LIKNILKNKSFPPHSSYFINKNYLKRISGYNHRFFMAPDYDLLLRLQHFTNKKFAVCEEVLTKVRVHHKNRSLKKIDNFSQLDFAILANVCFNLSKKFGKNPSNHLNDDEWSKLKSTFKLFLLSIDYYKFLINKIKFKKRKKINEYLKYFFSFNFIKSYFVGHVLPYKFQKKFLMIYKKKFLK